MSKVVALRIADEPKTLSYTNTPTLTTFFVELILYIIYAIIMYRLLIFIPNFELMRFMVEIETNFEIDVFLSTTYNSRVCSCKVKFLQFLDTVC